MIEVPSILPCMCARERERVAWNVNPFNPRLDRFIRDHRCLWLSRFTFVLNVHKFSLLRCNAVHFNSFFFVIRVAIQLQIRAINRNVIETKERNWTERNGINRVLICVWILILGKEIKNFQEKKINKRESLKSKFLDRMNFFYKNWKLFSLSECIFFLDRMGRTHVLHYIANLD